MEGFGGCVMIFLGLMILGESVKEAADRIADAIKESKK